MKFELCAASIEAIQLAKELNFDRVELCQNLEQGGLTPSFSMIDYSIAYGIPTHVLIRPRPGGFTYNSDELELIIREVVNCRNMGAAGIVIGVLNESGAIDEPILEEIMKKSGGLEVTFHRAFDDCVEWKKGMDILIKHGVKRILSSGLARNIDIGYPILSEMIKYAAGRIEIMTGGGVNASNIGRLVDELGPDAIHFSGTVKFQLDEESLFSESILKVDANKVKRILAAAGM
jgi:copper homeostasis protein